MTKREILRAFRRARRGLDGAGPWNWERQPYVQIESWGPIGEAILVLHSPRDPDDAGAIYLAWIEARGEGAWFALLDLLHEAGFAEWTVVLCTRDQGLMGFWQRRGFEEIDFEEADWLACGSVDDPESTYFKRGLRARRGRGARGRAAYFRHLREIRPGTRLYHGTSTVRWREDAQEARGLYLTLHADNATHYAERAAREDDGEPLLLRTTVGALEHGRKRFDDEELHLRWREGESPIGPADEPDWREGLIWSGNVVYSGPMPKMKRVPW